MKLRSEELAQRRERLLAQIAAQRADLERQLLVWRKPLQAFDAARHAGERLRKQSAVLIAVVSLLVIVSRGRVLVKVLAALKLARFAARTARWWALGRTLWRLGEGFARRPAPSAVNVDAGAEHGSHRARAL